MRGGARRKRKRRGQAAFSQQEGALSAVGSGGEVRGWNAAIAERGSISGALTWDQGWSGKDREGGLEM